MVEITPTEIAPESRLSSDRAAFVNPACVWKPITDSTPRGTKLQLVNRSAGVAQYSSLVNGESFFTHYYELPVFGPD